MSPSLRNNLDFLGFLFNRGLSYSMINTARGALCALIVIDHRPVGSHLLVIRLLQRASSMRLALPKNVGTWDQDVLLDYLKTQSPVKAIPMSRLTEKPVALIWLLMGQRGQSI